MPEVLYRVMPAIIRGNGKVCVGRTHTDIILDLMNEPDGQPMAMEHDKGFMIFVDRTQAAAYADKHGLVPLAQVQGGLLTSQDLARHGHL